MKTAQFRGNSTRDEEFMRKTMRVDVKRDFDSPFRNLKIEWPVDTALNRISANVTRLGSNCFLEFRKVTGQPASR